LPAARARGRAGRAADAVDVERLERADLEDAVLEVAAEERRLHVVAGEAPRHLGQVVVPKEKNSADLAISSAVTPRAELDHRADGDLDLPRSS
jgi:hypothetical protein